MLAYRKIPRRLLCDFSVNSRRQTVSGVVGSHVGAILLLGDYKGVRFVLVFGTDPILTSN